MQSTDCFKDEQLIEHWMMAEAWPEYDHGATKGRRSRRPSVPTLSELCLRQALTTLKNGVIAGKNAAFSLLVSVR